jgi:predicted MPP superfamily phosphohydrolase
MRIAGLPPELAGKTLVQLSDLHIGQTVSDDYLIRSFQAVDLLKPDLVVVTGDFISYYGQRSWPQAENVLKHIPHGRLATLGCLGNHDYGHGWRQDAIATNMTALAQDCGIEVLRNESRHIAGLSVIGLEDYWGTRWHNKAASEATETAGPSIVLCHNPDVCDLPVWSNFQGWILSGHTHGGQCRIPFLRPPLLPVRNKRYTAGEFDLGNGRRLYINRALGYLRRIRFCVRPEVTVFTLQPA